MRSWILRYTIGTQEAGRFLVTALLVRVDADGCPVYQILKVQPT